MHVEKPERLDRFAPGDQWPLDAASAALDALAEIRERWPARSLGRHVESRWWHEPGALTPRSALIELEVVTRHAGHSLVACYGAPIRWTTPPSPEHDWSPVVLRRCDPDPTHASADRLTWLEATPYGQAALAYTMEAGWDFAPTPEPDSDAEWAAIVVPDSCLLSAEDAGGAPTNVHFGTLAAFAVLEGQELLHLWVARAYRRHGYATALARSAAARRARGPFTDDGLAFARAAGLLSRRSNVNGRR